MYPWGVVTNKQADLTPADEDFASNEQTVISFDSVSQPSRTLNQCF